MLERIREDAETLADFSAVLPSGGRLVLLVPALAALPALYGALDAHLQHFRRYRRRQLERLVTEAGFHVDTIRYLNRPAAPGWWLNSRVLRRTVLPKVQLTAFRWVEPLLKLEERHQPRFGLSLLVLARRP
jgi:hypothetical protein